MKGSLRIFALLLSVCLIFTMTACNDPSAPSGTIAGTETTGQDAELEWKSRQMSLFENRVKEDITHIELLTFESANSITDINPQQFSDYSPYDRDYFKQNSLILYQTYVLVGEKYSVPVSEVRADGEQIILVKKVSTPTEDPAGKRTMVSASRVDSTFIEVHNFIPKISEVKLIYEYDEPPVSALVGAEQQGTMALTQSESAALPQYQYLDHGSVNSLIERLRSSEEGEVHTKHEIFPRSFFNIHDLIMVQAITSSDDEIPPTIGRVERNGNELKVTIMRYEAVPDTPTAENTKCWCLLVSTRCFRPEPTEVKVEYHTYAEHQDIQ